MQENVSVWPPSEEDLELMSQRGFVCMRDCQSEFLRITVKHVGNFHVKIRRKARFVDETQYQGPQYADGLHRGGGTHGDRLSDQEKIIALPYRDPAVVRQVSRAANVSTVRRSLRVSMVALPWGARCSRAASFSVRILRGRSKPHFSGRVWG